MGPEHIGETLWDRLGKKWPSPTRKKSSPRKVTARELWGPPARPSGNTGDSKLLQPLPWHSPAGSDFFRGHLKRTPRENIGGGKIALVEGGAHSMMGLTKNIFVATVLKEIIIKLKELQMHSIFQAREEAQDPVIFKPSWLPGLSWTHQLPNATRGSRVGQTLNRARIGLSQSRTWTEPHSSASSCTLLQPAFPSHGAHFWWGPS